MLPNRVARQTGAVCADAWHQELVRVRYMNITCSRTIPQVDDQLTWIFPQVGQASDLGFTAAVVTSLAGRSSFRASYDFGQYQAVGD